VTDVYNAIKALEAEFPIPQATATCVIGTFDAQLGHFTYAVPTETLNEPLPRTGPGAGPFMKPSPHLPPRTIAVVSVLNAENVTLQFNVTNRQGRDFILSVPGHPDVHAPQGEDFVRLNVGQASGITGFTLTCGKRFTSSGPIEINYRLVGVGVFTIPALPLSIVYAPPADQSKKNTASWSFSKSSGVSFTLDSSKTTSTQSHDVQFGALGDLVSAIDTVAKELGDSHKDITGPLGKASAALSIIPKLVGQTTITNQVSTTSDKKRVLSLTFTEQQKVTTTPDAGGPGSGDLIYYLVNVRLCWVADNGTLHLALLGCDSNEVASISVGFLRNHGAQTGLSPAAIQSLLALDPFVAGGPQASLTLPRFKPATPPVLEVNATNDWQISESYTFSQADTSTTQTNNVHVTDMQAGWLSILGIGPSKTETDTIACSFSSAIQTSVERTISDAANLFAGTDEIYSLEIYVDVIFGTLAFRSAPITATAKLAGTVHDTFNRPVPYAQVMLVNNGKQYLTRADAQGRYAFHSASIAPGQTAISSGRAQIQLAFAGKPLGNLDLKPTALRTA
jgi:hypothetical protein